MSTGQDVTYRSAAPGDAELLTRMLWIAFNWRDETVSEDHWPDPHAKAKYVDGFGRHGDAGVVAELADEGVGAAWYRLLPADDAGYGFVADDVPELTLGVSPQARGRGIGKALMEHLLEMASADGFAALSLSVEPDNAATRLYLALGFEHVGASGGSVTLLRRLQPPPPG